MRKISIKNLARAIFESTVGKEGNDMEALTTASALFIKNNNLLWKKEEILLALENIINKENSTIKIKVSTTSKLPEETKNEIENFIKERYKVQKVIMENKEDQKLLGGIKIQIGDEIIDATLSNKLNQLQSYLTTH